MKGSLVLMLAASAAVAPPAIAQSAEATMDRAARLYTGMTSMRADFQQTITNPLTGTRAVSRGVLLRRDPNLLSIEFSDPKGDRIVSDGTNLWVYLPSSAPNQVLRMPAGAGGAMGAIDPGGLFLNSPSTRYNITAEATTTVGGRRVHVLRLVPKGSGHPFSSARVWVDASDHSIRQFEVVDANGLTRLVAISNVRSAPAIQSSAFQFTPPRGARVVEGGF